MYLYSAASIFYKQKWMETVCYHANCYIPRLRVQSVVLQGSLWHSKGMICVDLSENALFTSFGVIYCSKLLNFPRASDSMT